MGRFDELILDAWTPLDYKQVIRSGTAAGANRIAPVWVGSHARRLAAYKVLSAYKDNAARSFLQFDLTTDEEERREQRRNRREYGDAGLLIEQVRSALIGDQQVISVEDAEDFNEDAEDPPPNQEELKAKAARMDELQQWAQKERFGLKLIETERNAVALGDGVYSLGWDAKKKRLRLRTWDPGFYFPVLDDASEDYPEKVHIAWELVDEDEPSGKLRIRRITWELRDVEPYAVPWGDEPATQECFLSDGIWTLDSGRRSLEDLTDSGVVWQTGSDADGNEIEMHDVPLGIDFVPVVHVPNTVALANHFGRSTLASVLQLLDDIQATDSDLQAAATLYGTPMLAVSGAEIDKDQLVVGPGEAISLGENGSAELLTPGDLGVLQSFLEFLLKRLSVNGRVPEAVLGRVDPSKIASGVLLALSFGPLTSLIDEMRLVRDEKYPLLLKFVQRFHMLKGEWVGDEQPAELVFGSYLPSDQQSTVTTVTALLAAKAISLQTAIKMLQDVGIPVTDPAQEIAEIEKRDYEGAVQLFDATGDQNAVDEKLGTTSPPRPTAPSIDPNALLGAVKAQGNNSPADPNNPPANTGNNQPPPTQKGK